MSKGSAPASPDYSGIANADTQSAQEEYSLGQQQLQFSQNQFNQEWPYAQQYLQQQTNASAQQQQFAQQQEGVYTNTFQPMEQQFAQEASNYNSPAQAGVNAGASMADVSNTFNAQKAAATSQLESYGVDPSQTRFQALDLNANVQQAAATAAAGTQSRLQTQATGLGLQDTAINIGQGYPSNIANTVNSGSQAGASGINSTNSVTNTATNSFGAAQSFLTGGLSSQNSGMSALNTGFQNQLGSAELTNQQQGNVMGGLGALVGGGLAVASLAY